MTTNAPPGMAALSLDAQRVPPNQSLYVQNLPEKLQKEDLRRELYILFSTYGSVIDVTALKSAKMRGQAHILFKDVQSAAQAMRACQGFDFVGRQMKISYSKNRSNTLAKLTGTVNQPAPTEQPKQLAQVPAPSSLPPPPGTTPSARAPPAVLPGPPSSLPPPPGLPPKPVAANGKAPTLQPPPKAPEDVASPKGVKRAREESDEEEDEEESAKADDDGDMEMSDEDD